jgi:FkbM family methyltransferase
MKTLFKNPFRYFNWIRNLLNGDYPDDIVLPRLIPFSVRKSVITDSYEKHERLIANKLVEPNDCIIELGSGYGIFAAMLYRVKGFQSITCVEGDLEKLKLLSKTLDLNLPKNIWKVEGKYVAASGSNYGFTKSGRSHHLEQLDDNKKSIIEKSQCASLESLLKDRKYNCLVFDIEGLEYEVINIEELKGFGIKKLIFELHEINGNKNKYLKFLSRLEKEGYERVEESNDRYGYILNEIHNS